MATNINEGRGDFFKKAVESVVERRAKELLEEYKKKFEEQLPKIIAETIIELEIRPDFASLTDKVVFHIITKEKQI